MSKKRKSIPMNTVVDGNRPTNRTGHDHTARRSAAGPRMSLLTNPALRCDRLRAHQPIDVVVYRRTSHLNRDEAIPLAQLSVATPPPPSATTPVSRPLSAPLATAGETPGSHPTAAPPAGSAR